MKDVKYDYVKDISCIIISHGLNSNTDNAQKLYDPLTLQLLSVWTSLALVEK